METQNDLSLSAQVEQYFKEIKAQEGIIWPDLYQYVSYYEKAGDFCDVNDADPIDFINSILEHIPAARLTPKQLVSKHTEKYYQDYMGRQQRIPLEDKFKIFESILKSELKKGYSEEEILLTRFINFDAWFRICYSTRFSQRIYDKFKKDDSAKFSKRLMHFLVSKHLDYRRLLK